MISDPSDRVSGSVITNEDVTGGPDFGGQVIKSTTGHSEVSFNTGKSSGRVPRQWKGRCLGGKAALKIEHC